MNTHVGNVVACGQKATFEGNTFKQAFKMGHFDVRQSLNATQLVTVDSIKTMS